MSKTKVESKTRVELEIVLRDKDGKVILKRKQESKSFVRNWNRWLQTHLYGVGQNVVDAFGITWTLYIAGAAYGSPIVAEAAIGAATHGLVCGSSSTAPAKTNYILGTLIAHGTGSGQLQYQASNVSAQEASDTDIIQISRVFINGSGATVTVREAGIYAYSYSQVPSLAYINFLILHDVFTAISVAHGESLTLTYKIKSSI